MGEKRCRTCEFCDKKERYSESQGVCRLNPPERISQHGKPTVYKRPTAVILDKDWCGKHKFKHLNVVTKGVNMSDYKDYEVMLDEGKMVFLKDVTNFGFGTENLWFERDGIKIAVFDSCKYFAEAPLERTYHDYIINSELEVDHVNNVYYHKDKIKFYEDSHLVAGFINTISFRKKN